jgi:hypothetical protein
MQALGLCLSNPLGGGLPLVPQPAVVCLPLPVELCL